MSATHIYATIYADAIRIDVSNHTGLEFAGKFKAAEDAFRAVDEMLTRSQWGHVERAIDAHRQDPSGRWTLGSSDYVVHVQAPEVLERMEHFPA